jgi:hypothetical protein
MPKDQLEPDFVSHIGDSLVVVKAHSPGCVETLVSLKACKCVADADWELTYLTKNDLVTIVRELIKAGIPFAGGLGGWPPGAIVETLRDEGRIAGAFKQISWTGPNQTQVYEQ